jgi:aminomethyltransferase
LPRFPNELGEDYIPLEAGVWDAVSFSKGCYIGQEIIARMESRNQLAKRLMRLAVVGGAPAPGEALRFGNQPAGKLTSVAGAHALGYVRSALIEAGRVLETEAGQVEILAQVQLK